MDINDYREALKTNNYNYNRNKDVSILFRRKVEKWINEKTGDKVYLLFAPNGKTIMTREIGLTDLVPDVVVTSNNSTWAMDDVKGAAMERGIKMSDEQAQHLLEDNAKGIGTYGWDGISNVLDDVRTCDECSRAVDVIPDTETDNGSYELLDGLHICEDCKIKGDYVACIECEAYHPKGLMKHVGGIAPDQQDYVCPSCEKEEN